MPLPYSRNTTYAPGDEVLSADLNAMQGAAVSGARAAESAVIASLSRWDVSGVFTTAPSVVGYDAYEASWWALCPASNQRALLTLAGWASVGAMGVTVSAASPYAANLGSVNLVAFDPAAATASRLLRSVGAVTWATADLPVSYDGVTRLHTTATHFLAVQADGATYRSTTGATGSWSAAGALSGGVVAADFEISAQGFIGTTPAVAFCNNSVTAGSGRVVFTTDNGASFSSSAISGASAVYGICYDPSRAAWLASGAAAGAPALWSSTDLVSWTSVTVSVTPFHASSTSFGYLRAEGGALSAWDTAHNMLVSRDGLSWRYINRNPGGDRLRSAGGRLWYIDGVTKTALLTGPLA